MASSQVDAFASENGVAELIAYVRPIEGSRDADGRCRVLKRWPVSARVSKVLLRLRKIFIDAYLQLCGIPMIDA